MTEAGGPQSASTDLIRGYFRKLWVIHTQPRRFFAARPSSEGISGPLAFGLVTHWIASAISYLSVNAMGDLWMSASRKFGELTSSTREAEVYTYRTSSLPELHDLGHALKTWASSVGFVIADPFLTLMRLLVVSTVVWVGARLLINPVAADGVRRDVSWEAVMRISSYALAASILSIIPVAGFGLSQLGVLVLTVIGIQEIFRVSTLRALVVAIFPTLLIIGLVLVGIFFFGFLILHFVTSMF